MTSNKPYLLRAIHEWIIDNDMTPHILVDAEAEAVFVPTKFVQDGKIILNIAPGAVESLQLGNTEVAFNARFSGVSELISIPVQAVLAIYGKENGKGMMFTEDEPKDTPGPPDATSGAENKPGKPVLKVVK